MQIAVAQRPLRKFRIDQQPRRIGDVVDLPGRAEMGAPIRNVQLRDFQMIERSTGGQLQRRMISEKSKSRNESPKLESRNRRRIELHLQRVITPFLNRGSRTIDVHRIQTAVEIQQHSSRFQSDIVCRDAGRVDGELTGKIAHHHIGTWKAQIELVNRHRLRRGSHHRFE